MSRERFRELRAGSFLGDHLYDQVVPQDHILRELDRAIDWARYTARLLALYRGKGRVGRPPYDPAVLVRMLVLSRLCGLSERAMEAYVNDSISAKWFLGLAVDQAAPDHSTLTALKRRTADSGERPLEDLVEEIIRQAAAAGVDVNSMRLVKLRPHRPHSADDGPPRTPLA